MIFECYISIRMQIYGNFCKIFLFYNRLSAYLISSSMDAPGCSFVIALRAFDTLAFAKPSITRAVAASSIISEPGFEVITDMLSPLPLTILSYSSSISR